MTETVRLWLEGSQAELLEHAAALLHLDPADARPAEAQPDLAPELGHPLPMSLRGLLARDGLYRAVSSLYSSIPPRVDLLPAAMMRAMGDRPVVGFWAEEQGVCLWAVALDEGHNPPVLAFLADEREPGGYSGPHPFAPSVGHVALALAWERALHAARPVLHLSAGPEPGYRERLVELWGPSMTTHGWPGKVTYRFDGPQGRRMLVWDDSDTYISADSEEALAALCADLPADLARHFDPLGDDQAIAFWEALNL